MGNALLSLCFYFRTGKNGIQRVVSVSLCFFSFAKTTQPNAEWAVDIPHVQGPQSTAVSTLLSAPNMTQGKL